MKTSYMVIRLVLTFLWEFIKANLTVAYIILFVPKTRIQAQLKDYSIRGLSRREALLLAQLITLTPGTIAAGIDLENEKLRIHILSLNDAQSVLDGIDKGLKKAVLGVSRSWAG